MMLTKLCLVVHMLPFHVLRKGGACATGISATILTPGLVPGLYMMSRSKLIY